MFKSTEIRWFRKFENIYISNWFARQGFTFENSDARTDHYLPNLDKNAGFKLREGNVELKHQTVPPRSITLLPSVSGKLETYKKWSFSTSKQDVLSREIIEENNYDWIKVIKERMGIKVWSSHNENTRWVEISEELEYGCQIEYTRIKIKDETWFTFGLEWFGDKEVALQPQFLNEILGNTNLENRHSMGYAEFLSKNYNPKHS